MRWSKIPVPAVGVDIVAVERIERLIARFGVERLRFLTPAERARLKRPEQVAGVFAAKEAFGKSLGVGIGEALSFREIEVGWTSAGKPFLKPTPRWREWGILAADLSITHDGGFAVAVVVLLRTPDRGEGGLPEGWVEEEGHPN